MPINLINYDPLLTTFQQLGKKELSCKICSGQELGICYQVRVQRKLASWISNTLAYLMQLKDQKFDLNHTGVILPGSQTHAWDRMDSDKEGKGGRKVSKDFALVGWTVWHLFSKAKGRSKFQLIHSCVSPIKYYLTKSIWALHSLIPSFLTGQCFRYHARGRPFDGSLKMLFSFLIRTHQQTAILFSHKQLPALEDMLEAKTAWTPYSPTKSINTSNENQKCRRNTL